MDLSRSETAILDLATRPDGYLVALGEDVIRLREKGFVTIRIIGGGYVIARAVPQPAKPIPGHTVRGCWAKGHRKSQQDEATA